MADMPVTAMILAAGKGTRMQSFFPDLPKPLVPVAGKSLLDHALDFAFSAGVKRVIVNTSYMAEKVEQHLRSKADKRIEISRESEPLETGGGIAHALPLLGREPFFVINSDVICRNTKRHALHRLAEAWDKTMDGLLLLHPTSAAYGYAGAGDFFHHSTGALKRRGEAALAPYIFSGIQLLHPRMFKNVPPGAFSLNILYNRYVQPGKWSKGLYGMVHEGEWFHAGDGEGVKLAEKRLATADANVSFSVT